MDYSRYILLSDLMILGYGACGVHSRSSNHELATASVILSFLQIILLSLKVFIYHSG